MHLDMPIAGTTSDRLVEALNETPPGARVVLDLDSPGGYNSDGIAIMDAIDAARRRSVTIVTRVRAGERCASLCVFLFAAGQEREAEPGADFVVHGSRSIRTGQAMESATSLLIDEAVLHGADGRRLLHARQQGLFDLTDHVLSPGQLQGIGIPLHIIDAEEARHG